MRAQTLGAAECNVTYRVHSLTAELGTTTIDLALGSYAFSYMARSDILRSSCGVQVSSLNQQQLQVPPHGQRHYVVIRPAHVTASPKNIAVGPRSTTLTYIC